MTDISSPGFERHLWIYVWIIIKENVNIEVHRYVIVIFYRNRYRYILLEALTIRDDKICMVKLLLDLNNIHTFAILMKLLTCIDVNNTNIFVLFLGHICLKNCLHISK